MKSFVNTLLVGAFFNTASALGVRGFNSSSIHTSKASTTTSKSSTITSIPSSLSSITASTNASICATGIAGLYAGYTDLALQCYCVTQFLNWVSTSNPPTRTITRTQGIGSTTETITSGATTITSVFQYVTTEYFLHTGNVPGADGFDWPGSATSPCCSSCTIAAQTVNLFYWPTPAIPGQATSFVSDGYTYVSPSVYMGFTSLSAFDYCGTVGNVYTSTTFAFAPDELSTVGSPLASTYVSTDTDTDYTGGVTTETFSGVNSYGGPASAINYRDLGQNCSTISGYSYLAGIPLAAGMVTYDPCHPTIILPAQVKSIDPAWASCANNLIGGFYDPPYALTSQGVLAPFSTTSATPAQTPQSDQAPSTAPTTAQPTSTPPPPIDPVTQPSSTPDSPPPATSDSASPVNPSSTPQPDPPATSNPADSSDPPAPPASSNTAPTDPATSDPATSNPDPIQSASTPTQETAASPSTTPQAPVLGSQTLTPGGPPITVSGTVLSLDPSGSSVVLGGSTTVPLSAVVSLSQKPVVVESQTLAPGGEPITVSGTVLSLDSSGSSVVINGGSTVPLTAIVPASETPVVIGSQTIQPGGSPITISGAVFSLEPSGAGVVVNGASTIPAASIEAEISSIISAPAVLGTQTLIPGGAPITVDGTTYSLQSTGGNVVVNGAATIPLSSANAAISSAVDGAIASAIASIMGVSPTATTVIGGSTFVIEGSSTVPIASATGTNSSGPVQFTGSASRAGIKMETVSAALIGLLGGVMLLM